MPLFCFKNTPFKGVYKDPTVYKEIVAMYPDASYRKFQKKEDKEEALKWAGVSKITKTKEFFAQKNKLISQQGPKNEKKEKEMIASSDGGAPDDGTFKLNDNISLVPFKWEGYISTSWDSYDYSTFTQSELNDLYEAYEIYENGQKTGCQVYFYHDMDVLSCIDLLLIPSGSKQLFDAKYKQFFIDETKKEPEPTLPFELRTMFCTYCHGQGCVECY